MLTMTDCLICKNDAFYNSLAKHVKETQEYDTDICLPEKEVDIRDGYRPLDCELQLFKNEA